MQSALIKSEASYKIQAGQLHDALVTLRSLTVKKEMDHERRKQHVARELHDDLGQLLTALKLKVGLISMEYAQQEPELIFHANSMQDIIERAILSTRNAVRHLRPPALDMGLMSALEWVRDDFSNMFKTKCVLSCECVIPTLNEFQLISIF